jgi:hypothetical protein
MSQLLCKVNTVLVPRIRELTITKEILEEINVRWTGIHWKKFFLGKKEKAVQPAVLTGNYLEKNSLDSSIVAQLSNCGKLFVSQLLWLIKRQSRGQNGFLFTDSYANIMHIEIEEDEVDSDKKCILPVYALWDDQCGGWGVSASPKRVFCSWSAGVQFITCDT